MITCIKHHYISGTVLSALYIFPLTSQQLREVLSWSRACLFPDSFSVLFCSVLYNISQAPWLLREVSQLEGRVRAGGQEEVRICLLSCADTGGGSGSRWVSFVAPAARALASGLESSPTLTPTVGGSGFSIQLSSGCLTILCGFSALPSPK